MNKIIKLIIVYSILIEGCFRYKIVELDELESTQIPVINCLFTADSTFKIWTGLTKNIFQDQPDTIENLEIKIISQNGDTIFFHKKNEHIYESDSVAKKGIIYYLNVKTSKYGILKAKSYIPLPKTNIDSFSIVYSQNNSYQYDYFVKLFFKDIKDTRNYYQLSCLNKIISENLDSCYFIRILLKCNSNIFLKEKLDISNHQNYIIFSDIGYENKTIMLDFFLLAGTITPRDKIILYLKNLSEDYFLYQKSLLKTNNINSSNIDNFITSGFFCQNSDVYSNIENGLGIFAGYNNDTYIQISDSNIVTNKKLKSYLIK